MNISGAVVVAVGVILIVIALRNTQSNVFPFFFSNPNGTTTTPAAPVIGPGGTGVAGLGCPPCYSPFTYLGVQWCKLDSISCLLSNGLSTTNAQSIVPMTGSAGNTIVPA